VTPAPVLIGFDGSDAAANAIRAAGRLLAPRPALVVSVWERGVAYESFELATMPMAPLDTRVSAEMEESLYDGARMLAGRGAALAREAGFDAEPLTVADERSIADTLIHLAEDRGADVIVVGAQGRSRLEEMLMGSTSRGLVRHAGRPVLVVPMR
jgi:nucleotide-binding universal stress UspA family protein